MAKHARPTLAPAVLHTALPLIEVAEDWLLDALLADTTAARYIVLRLSPTVAIVQPDGVDPLLTRLRKLGHTPRVLDDAAYPEE